MSPERTRTTLQAAGAYLRLIAVLSVLVAVFSAGCTTTESDMPWNAPQSWEGSPAIPGLSGQGF